jgi:hypothetical protein
VAVVTAEDLQPLAGELLDGGWRKDVGVGHLAPDEEPQAIAPVEEAWILDLLMNAHPVEPVGLDQLDLAA